MVSRNAPILYRVELEPQLQRAFWASCRSCRKMLGESACRGAWVVFAYVVRFPG